LVTNYLEQLQGARECEAGAAIRYEWSMLALIDQVARDRPGGEMTSFLSVHDAESLDWVFAIEGSEIKSNHNRLHAQHFPRQLTVGRTPRAASMLRRIRPTPGNLRKFLSRMIDGLVAVFPKGERKALEIGRFRLSGEVHRWMYDAYSLGRALKAAGFVDVVQRTAYDSYVSNWHQEQLDTEADGSVYKPSSLFMEALKPCA
jgi:hypothetical protein